MARVEFDTNEDDEGGSFSQDSNDEPQTRQEDAPSTEKFDRDTFVADAFSEGTEDAVLEELAGKEDITLDDLRQLPGAESLTDAQLTAAWDKAQKEAGLTEDAEGGTKVELPFPVYDAQGNKVASDKVTLGDLLSGKVTLGYNAMGKEQRKSLQDVIRNASQGHWNEQRYNTVNEQYRAAHQKVTSLETQVRQFNEQQAQWNSVLTALAMGDNGPMKTLFEAYKAALGKSGMPTPEGFVPQDTVRAQQEASERGQQWYTEVGMPAAIDIAGRYDANPKEVIGAIQYFIEREPVLTPQRIQEILDYDVPMAFEAKGYVAKGNPVNDGENEGSTPEGNGEVAALKKQVEALTQRLAGTNNDRTSAIREKNKRVPSQGSGATSGAGDSMPSFKNREQMKEWLRS